MFNKKLSARLDWWQWMWETTTGPIRWIAHLVIKMLELGIPKSK